MAKQPVTSPKRKRRFPLWLKIVVGLFVIAGILVCSSLAVVAFDPGFAAQNIDNLRDVVGDDAVAQLEQVVLTVQDDVQQLEYQLGLVKPSSPWANTTPISTVQPNGTKVAAVASNTSQPVSPTLPNPTTSTSTQSATTTALQHVSPSAIYTTTVIPSTITRTPSYTPPPTLTATAPTNVPTRPSLPGNIASPTKTLAHSSVLSTEDVATPTGTNTPSSTSIPTTVATIATSEPTQIPPTVTVTFTFTPPPIIVTTVAASLPATISATDTLPATTATSGPTQVPPTDSNTSTFTPPPIIITIPPTLIPSLQTNIAPSAPSPTVATATPIQSSTPSAIATAWQPAPIAPLGTISGEGQWSPYLYAPDGTTIVAYRTFLQPDQKRPYSIPAIVAFDLQTTNLHFVLGRYEPRSITPEPSRTGTIPTADMQPGKLIATFNGGFKARHGDYGAMADGLVALTPINGLATVGIYKDGHVQIGKWGTDIQDSPDLVSWRQNGEMLIYNGQVNPETARNTALWGLAIDGNTVTWRSAIGISADGRTLYYVAGLELNVSTLTKVVAQTGAAQSLQLDVNNYWVHFAAIRSNGTGMVAEPLLDAMKTDVDRFLKPSSRDFFYVTVASNN